uniref:ATP synthase F0 subunit 8 n=1 Tax=Timema cristinae TaxID=61476 RepID=A0A7R9CU55_TIMCR|nr:unnamed protein product [Timema cristinae]
MFIPLATVVFVIVLRNLVIKNELKKCRRNLTKRPLHRWPSGLSTDSPVGRMFDTPVPVQVSCSDLWCLIQADRMWIVNYSWRENNVNIFVALVMLSSTAEDGEIEVRISVSTASYYPFGLYALSTNYANGMGIGKVELEEVNPHLREVRVENHLGKTTPSSPDRRFEPLSPRPQQSSSTRLAR